MRRKLSRKRHNDDTQSTMEKFPKVDVVATASSSSVTTVEAEDICCVCFQDYQGDNENTDWVQCACHRWLHEDCISDIVYDVHGRELFCPYCAL